MPGQPITRLQFMGWQIKELAVAIHSVRDPLQDFALPPNDEQRARFAVMIAAPTGVGRDNGTEDVASRCGGTPSAIDQLIGQIRQIGLQRDALADVKQAIERAASDLTARCQTPVPLTALS